MTARVAVLGLGSTTHAFDSGQRPLAVSFTQNGPTVAITLPDRPDMAPPGYYMAFVMDERGAPSRGVIIALGADTVARPAARPQPTVPFDGALLKPDASPWLSPRHDLLRAM